MLFRSNLADGLDEGLQPRPADLARRAERRDAGHVQGFADIDIAQPRHDPLVQQQGLGALFAALEGAGQMGGVEIIRQGLDRKSVVQGKRVDLGGRRTSKKKKKKNIHLPTLH